MNNGQPQSPYLPKIDRVQQGQKTEKNFEVHKTTFCEHLLEGFPKNDNFLQADQLIWHTKQDWAGLKIFQEKGSGFLQLQTTSVTEGPKNPSGWNKTLTFSHGTTVVPIKDNVH